MIEKLRFYTRHSLNDLRVNGQRTIFALLCIAAGVASIVSLQTLGVMIEHSITGNLQESNGGDIRIMVYGYIDEEEDSSTQALHDRGVDEGVIEEGGTFAADYISPQGIDTITAWFEDNYEGDVQITYRQAVNSMTAGISIGVPERDTEKTFVMPYIVDAQAYPLYGERETDDGETLSELLQGPNDILISQNLADDLDASVGDTIRLSGAREDFVLRGILPNDAESGFENMMGALFGYYFIDVSAVDLFDEMDPGADMLYVKLEDPSGVRELSEAFDEQFPYLDTYTTADMEKDNSEISKVINQLVIIMGLISLLIGGIGIVNTMLVIVSRRTTEVAVLKTIGLEGEQVTVLFLVEAVLMGIFGSLLGIVLGWIAAYAIKGVAGGFLSQSLAFRITAKPPVVGFVVGVIMTTIFGFMPTLAAGQVRPNLVLRPSDTIIPQAGRARSFVALLVVMLAISLVAQTLIGDLLDSDTLRSIANSVGSVVGFLMAVAMIAGSIFSGWTRGKTGLRILRWVLLLGALPILGGMFGQAVPAILILGGTFIQVGILYVVLWTVIWSVGGGELRSIWLLKLPRKRSTITKVLLAVVFLPVWILNAALLILMLPFWLLGRLIQRLAVVDFKIALRSMLASKGRGASTLLALVVGVFTLSLITMLADAITKRFEQILVNEVGGNVIIFAAGYENTLEQVATELDTIDGVKSYAAIEIYGVELVSALDVSEDETLTLAELEARAAAKNEYYDDYVRWAMSGIDGRAVDANLPDVDFYAGSQLSEADTGPWDPETGDYPPLIVSADEALVATKLSVGDLLTFKFTSEEDQTITFRIAGMIDRTGAQIQVNFGSSNYAPRNAFPEGVSPDSMSAIVDVKESNIRDVRQAMNAIPGTFVLETKLLNDLMNRIIDQFTSFPILVAGLALVVGGIVIANSVALSTLERRREIAIMKAVGLQRERVLGMLLLEYGLMGLIGGLIGVGLGGIGLLLLLIQAFGGELGKSIPYMTAFSLMGLCIVIALAAAILTAWNASGEKPLNVLRYE